MIAAPAMLSSVLALAQGPLDAQAAPELRWAGLALLLPLVSGLLYGGDAMAEIARRHGVTRAAVSKRCVELTELLGLRPSRAMRSLTARESYRDARIRSLRQQ